MYRNRLYSVFILHHFLLWFYCVTPYTHGSYSYYIVWLLFLPLLLVHFFTVYTTRIHSLGALQHCNTWISLQFLWNSILAHGCLDYQHISGYLSHGFMKISLITYHSYGKNRVHRFQWYLSLYIVIALACCALWTCDCGNSMRYTNCIHTFSPSLSKYGVYNISPLIVLAHTVNCVLCTSIFISLCGFVPWLGVWTHY